MHVFISLAMIVISIACSLSIFAINLRINRQINESVYVVAIPIYCMMFMIMIYTLKDVVKNMFCLIVSVKDVIDKGIYAMLGIVTLVMIEKSYEFNLKTGSVLLLYIGVYQIIQTIITILGSFCCLYINRTDTGCNVVMSREMRIHKNSLYLIAPRFTGFYVHTLETKYLDAWTYDIDTTLKESFFNFTQILNVNRIASAYTFIRMSLVIDLLPDQKVANVYDHCMDTMIYAYEFYLIYNFCLMIWFSIKYTCFTVPDSVGGCWNSVKKYVWTYFVLAILSIRYIGTVVFYHGFFQYLVTGTNNNFMFFALPEILIFGFVGMMFLIGVLTKNQTILIKIDKLIKSKNLDILNDISVSDTSVSNTPTNSTPYPPDTLHSTIF